MKPIGYNEAGEPIEEVVTTATRLRGSLLGELLAVAGLAFLSYSIAEAMQPQRRMRHRRVRARRRKRAR